MRILKANCKRNRKVNGIELTQRRKISILLAIAIILQILLLQPGFLDDIANGAISVPLVTVSIDKTVGGVPIKTAVGSAFEAVRTGMSFDLYKVSSPNSGLEGIASISSVTLDENGRINFVIENPGWYAIKEVLTGDAAMTFAEVDPLYIYVGANGIMSSLDEGNIRGDYSVSWQPNFTKGLKLIYEYEGVEYVISGIKPDGSGQNFSTERFVTLMPDGTSIDSYCADLGAHNIWGNYVFDETNHNFEDWEMYYIIAAFDYINDLYKDQSGQPNGLSRVEGKILAQVVLWNLILKVDENTVFIDDWPNHVTEIPNDAKPVRVEGTEDWYDNWTVDGRTFRVIAEDIINNVSSYVSIYSAKTANPAFTGKYVTGAIFIKGDGVGYDGIDQQRQLLVLFGNSVVFDNRPVYDVALRKWVSKVNETVIGTPGEPNVEVPEVRPGDKVTFTIEVYNQTYNPTWVTHLVDYFPAGYEFDPADNDYWELTDTPWWMSGATTLRYTGPAIRLDPMGGPGASAQVQVVLTVKADGTDYRNAAEVLEIRDDGGGGPGKVVEDVDSTFNDEMRRRWNRQAEEDNEIGKNGKDGEDKDDYDFAEVIPALERTGVKVIKNWEDGENVSGLRPAEITVNLYRWYSTTATPTDLTVLTPYRSAVMTGSAAGYFWEYAFLDLPIYDSGGTFVYAVDEDADSVPGYTKTKVILTANGEWEITNKLVSIPTTEISVAKEWVDTNEESHRPSTVTVTLMQNSEPYGAVPYNIPVEIYEVDGWQYTFTGLPKYDANYVEYRYSIVEEPVTGYRAPVVIDEGNGNFTIINTFDYSQEKVSIGGSKTWVDDNDSYNTRPNPANGDIEVHLYQNGVEIRSVSIPKEGYDSSFIDGTYSFTGLDKYDADGNLYIYRIIEDPAPGYETTYIETTSGFDITNKLNFQELTTYIAVEKEWVDGGSGSSTRPAGVRVNLYQNGAATPFRSEVMTSANGWRVEFTGLPLNDGSEPPINYIYSVVEEPVDGYEATYGEYLPIDIGGEANRAYEITITNTLLPGTTGVTITKVWVDDNNSDFTRPASITVQLYQGDLPYGLPRTVTGDRAADTWEIGFTGLPRYDAANGYTEFVYTVREFTPPSSLYDSSISADGLAITNTLRPGTTEFSGRKIWSSNGLDPGSEDFPARPGSILVQLFQNGAPYGDPMVVTGTEWSYRFTDLPKYDSRGRKFEYTADETDTPQGYNKSIEGNNIINSVANGMVINVSVEKIWSDRGNVYRTRPDSIVVNLYRNNVFHDSYTLTASDNWTHTFTDLDKYDASFRPYNYTVDEVLPTVSGIDYNSVYSKTTSGNIRDGFTIENTLLPGTTSVSGRKIWVDGGLSAGTRPSDDEIDAVMIQLVRDGVDYGAPISISSYTRDYVFNNLPKYSNADQHQYEYTVRELASPGVAGRYSIDYDKDNDGRLIVVNTLGIEIRGTKEWSDRRNAGGARPASIEIVLLRRYSTGDPVREWEEYRRLTVTGGTTAASWNWSFGNVPTYYLVDPATREPIDPDTRLPNPETELYEYKIEEITVPGYDTVISGNTGTGFIITNTSTAPPPTQTTELDPEEDPPPPEDPEDKREGEDDVEEEDDGEDEEDIEGEEVLEERGEPGGKDRGRQPNPTILGNQLIPLDDGGWLEFDEDGTPLGEWHWDDYEEMWVFDEYPPLAGLPQTGDVGVPLYVMILLGCSMIGVGIMLGQRVILKRKAR